MQHKHDNPDQYAAHFRAWKSGKSWLYASSTVLLLAGSGLPNLALPFIAHSGLVAKAASSTTSGLQVTPANMSDYFTSIGSASAISNGQVVLTPNTNNQAGSAILSNQISLDSSFTISGQINLGDKSQLKGGADGIGFNFTPSNSIGNYGNGFGLGGIPNAVGFKFDTYYNSTADNAAHAAADPGIVGVTEPAANTAGAKGYSFGTFDSTNSSGLLTSTGNSSPDIQRIPEPDNAFHDVTFDYDGTSHIMTVTYNGQTWSENISAYVASLKAASADGNTANTYFSISASTGGSKNQQTFKLTDMQFYKNVTLNAGDSTIVIDPKNPTTWNPSDNFNTDTSTPTSSNSTGTPITAGDTTVTVTNPDGTPATTVDTSTPGNYKVTYTYTDTDTGEVASKTVTVTVKAPPAVTAKDTTVQVGASWTPADNYVTTASIASDGSQIPVTSTTVSVVNPDGTTSNTVDTSKPGDYQVTYTYTDANGQPVLDDNGKPVQDTGIVHVIGKPVLTSKDSTIFQGDTWNPADNYVSGTDSSGKALPPANSDGSLPAGVSITKVVGPNGNSSALTVDSSTPGIYQVTYSYTDPTTGLTGTTTATVTVGAPDINGHDSTIHTGDNWTPADNFDSVDSATKGNVTDYASSGTSVSQVVNPDGTTASNKTVDTSKPGNYQVTYSYTDTVNGESKTVSKTVTVTVIADPTVDGHNSTLLVGDAWTPSDNLDGVTNSQGTPINWGDPDLTVSVKNPDGTTSNAVNTKVPGTYQVTYSYTDPSTGEVANKTVSVTVKAPPAVIAKDSTVKAGTPWSPADNYVEGENSSDNPIVVGDTTVSVKNPDGTTSNTVDTNKPGDYQVTYSYKDPNGQTVTDTATVHVLNPPAVEGKDSTVDINSPWQPGDNYVTGLNSAGDSVQSGDTTVSVKNPDGTTSNTVDTSKLGDYQVTYTYTDPDGDSVHSTVTVHVVQTPVVNAHNSNINPGTDWKPSDNLDKVTDSQGKPVNWGDPNLTLSVKNPDGSTGTSVNTDKPGTYQVTYTYKDPKTGVSVAKTVTVTVKDDTSISSKPSDNITAGSAYNPSDDFLQATNADGTKGSLTNTNAKKVAVSITDKTGKIVWTGTADETVPASKLPAGTYSVTYSVTDAAGKTHSSVTSLTVDAPAVTATKATPSSQETATNRSLPAQESKQRQSNLPNTGEKNTAAASLLGITALAGAVALLSRRPKRKHDK